MIAYAPFGNRPAEVLGKKHGIGRHLELVAIPSVVAFGTALLVLDRDESPVAVASEIHLAANAPFLAGKLQTLPFAILIYFGVMQGAPGVDAMVGNADFFDLFQVEKTLAVRERMQRHDADDGIVVTGSGCSGGGIVHRISRHSARR